MSDTDSGGRDPGGRSDAPASAPARDGTGDGEPGSGRGSRDVVVPLRLYKTVTVFSTLIAVVCVVLGFVLLDAATTTGGILRAITGLVLVGGLGLDAGSVSAAFRSLRPVFAVLGLGGIGLGAGVYILGSRFRAEGMGKSQDDTDEPTSNG